MADKQHHHFIMHDGKLWAWTGNGSDEYTPIATVIKGNERECASLIRHANCAEEVETVMDAFIAADFNPRA
jgi:hypothetical protein